MAERQMLTPGALRQLLSYNPETGRMFWRARGVEWFRDDRVNAADAMCRAWNTKYAGKEAFTSRSAQGYAVTNIGGRVVSRHRVAIAILSGEWPAQKVDHINGIRGDDRAENLRVVTDRQNSCNRRGNISGTSRYKGVCWVSRRQAWIAVLSDRIAGKYLGQFKCETAAALAYDRAAMGAHGEFARLNINVKRTV